ncbi:hypothetical protein [uncultured Sulfitobacter sp.]|uniref:hypothetical protein n=1 Tax=uncultured Sulfitobacter sp. TaxID=191468 RepID=UPI0026109BC5|nr:hypothetical protein [uncultured Sulfitobacter sp.]
MFEMLRLQPALPTFAALPKSMIVRTYASRTLPPYAFQPSLKQHQFAIAASFLLR